MSNSPEEKHLSSPLWPVAAFAISVAGLAGSLYLSLGMGLKACPLCFYQRTFIMSLVAVLGVGLLAGLARSGRLGLIALPIAIAGLGVAGFHANLEVSGQMECPKGMYDLGTAPQQSLAMFVLATVFLLVDVLTNRGAGWVRWPLLIVGLALGGGLAYASTISNPPMQRPSPEAYEKPPDICRLPKES